MLVRLTERQTHWVQRCFVGGQADAFEAYLEEAPQLGHSVDLTLPPDAWHWAATRLADFAYTAAGGRSPEGGSAAMRAHQRVTRAVVARRRHPAFSRTAVLGTSQEIFPAWEGGRLHPFMSEAHPTSRFVVLVPKPLVWKDERVTVWDVQSPLEGFLPSDPLLQERPHVLFRH